ncbi:MAG: hypothetical protein ACOX8Q_01725 [Christensenellales bacterium]|jgi:hypothetical protein
MEIEFLSVEERRSIKKQSTASYTSRSSVSYKLCVAAWAYLAAAITIGQNAKINAAGVLCYGYSTNID